MGSRSPKCTINCSDVFIGKYTTVMTKINQHHQIRMEYIASFIRNYRLNSGMTQYDLSECTNSVHRNTIIRAEAAKNISLLKLFEILDAMELSPQDLFMEVE